jgi:hypothetical protein
VKCPGFASKSPTGEESMFGHGWKAEEERTIFSSTHPNLVAEAPITKDSLMKKKKSPNTFHKVLHNTGTFIRKQRSKETLNSECSRSCLGICRLVSGLPIDTNVYRCSTPSCNVVSCLHMACICPPVYFKSSQDDLPYLMYIPLKQLFHCTIKENVCLSSEQVQLKKYIFNPRLESGDVES